MFKRDYLQFQTSPETDLLVLTSWCVTCKETFGFGGTKLESNEYFNYVYHERWCISKSPGKCLSCSWNGLKCPLFGLALQTCYFSYYYYSGVVWAVGMTFVTWYVLVSFAVDFPCSTIATTTTKWLAFVFHMKFHSGNNNSKYEIRYAEPDWLFATA